MHVTIDDTCVEVRGFPPEDFPPAPKVHAIRVGQEEASLDKRYAAGEDLAPRESERISAAAGRN
jgi:hypothetical protein